MSVPPHRLRVRSMAVVAVSPRSLRRSVAVCHNFLVTDLDISDIKERSERGRTALLQAVANVPDDIFAVDADGGGLERVAQPPPRRLGRVLLDAGRGARA